MITTIEEIQTCSEKDRLRVIEDIWSTLDGPPDRFERTPARREELERRLEEHRRDPGSAVPAEQAHLMLRQRISG